jgi:hypothetical protein
LDQIEPMKLPGHGSIGSVTVEPDDKEIIKWNSIKKSLLNQPRFNPGSIRLLYNQDQINLRSGWFSVWFLKHCFKYTIVSFSTFYFVNEFEFSWNYGTIQLATVIKICRYLILLYSAAYIQNMESIACLQYYWWTRPQGWDIVVQTIFSLYWNFTKETQVSISGFLFLNL